MKIEGRQRSSAYVKEVTQAWRQAIDTCKQQESFVVEQRWQQKLANLSEGNQTTLGAYHKSWQ